MQKSEYFNETWVTFREVYASLYPDKVKSMNFSSHKYQHLGYMFSSLDIWGSIMVKGYRASRGSYPTLTEDVRTYDSLHPDEKRIWLLYEIIFEDFRDKLVSLIMELDDYNLTMADYADLLYINAQDDVTQSLLKSLPLPLLHDALEPIARSNFKLWVKT
jgi:hypothetical protein